MYASDFLQKGISSHRMYLSGDNSFVKELTIKKILKDWNSPQIVQASKNSDIKIYGNMSVFGRISVAYILSGKAEFKQGLGLVIKTASAKMPKKYKDLGFQEVACNDLFPNQIEAFCQKFLVELGVNLPPIYSKFICVSCNYDLVAITNVAKILSYLEPSYVTSLSYQDFAMVCGNLCVADESEIVSQFIDGNYSNFLNKLVENPRMASSVLWGLVYALMRVKETKVALGKTPTWYQKKLLACAQRMEHFGLDRVIMFTHNLAENFTLKFPQIMLELTRLIKMIKGEMNLMVGVDR